MVVKTLETGYLQSALIPVFLLAMPLFVKFIKPLSDKDGRLDKKKKKGAGFVGFIFS